MRLRKLKEAQRHDINHSSACCDFVFLGFHVYKSNGYSHSSRFADWNCVDRILCCDGCNYHDHYGMKKVTTQTNQQIYSASGSKLLNLLLYKPVGTSGKNNVYIYDKKQSQKTPSHTKADEYTYNKIKTTNSQTAAVTTNTTRWEYKNDFYADLFMWSGMNHKIVKRVNTFYIPRTWLKLSVSQATKLEKLMKSSAFKTQMTGQGKQYVETELKAAMMKDPQMTAAQQAKLASHLQQQFEIQALKQAIK